MVCMKEDGKWVPNPYSLFHALREWAVFDTVPNLKVPPAALRLQSGNVKEALRSLKEHIQSKPQPIQDAFAKLNTATRVWLRDLVEAEADLRDKKDSFWMRKPGESAKLDTDNIQDRIKRILKFIENLSK